jgi:RND family efflux transporter MFP subunit
MTAAACPTRELLHQYSIGMLSDEQSDELASHLDACPDCQATILTMEDAEDTLIGRLRTPPASEPYSAEPPFLAALAKALATLGGTGVSPVSSSSADDTPVPPSKEDLFAASLPRALGEYQITAELGHGGMGRVYKALHTKLDRVVAVKVLTRGRVGDRQAIGRFEREMKAVGRLAHPNIVQAYDAREIDGTPVLIMEFVDGLDLAELVRRARRLPVAEACELIRQTALALQCAHEHGLVHRDIKPSNIMLARSGEVKLLDLGLARFYSGGLSAEGGTGVSPVLAESTGKMPVPPSTRPAPPSEEMTGTGQAMGTADYMAPEQAADSRTVDIRADLYSLGCTLYKLLSGQGPFSGPAYQGTLEKMHAHVHQPAPPIRQLVPELPEALAAIVDRLLAKDPADRFSIPAEVASALAPWCVGADLPALFLSPLPPGEGRRSLSPLPPGEGQGEGCAVCSSPLVSAAGQGEGSRAAKPQTASWGWRSIVAVVGMMLFVGGFCFAMGIMIRIKKDGQETAIEVPEGSTTRVGADGQVEVALPGQKPGQAAAPMTFRTVAVTRGDLTTTVSATGTLEPEEVVDVGAKVTGQIVSLGEDPHNKGKSIDYGSLVEQGTILARLDDAIYKARVDQEEAGCRRAEAELTMARARREPPEVAKLYITAAEAALAQSRAALSQAKTNLEATLIRSPIKGFVVDRRVNIGQTVVTNLNAPSLFLIGKALDKMQVWASVNEADIRRIRQGMEARFTVDAFPNEVFQGKVTQIRLNATLTQNVVTYTVVIIFDNPHAKLLPYLTAHIRFPVGNRKNVLMVPMMALRWKPRPGQIATDVRPSAEAGRDQNSRGRLWVKDEDGTHVRRVAIQVGTSDGTMTEVSGPEVKEGIEVVVGEEPRATDGGVIPSKPSPAVLPR